MGLTNGKDVSRNLMEVKPRKPWIAGILTFIMIGLGHIYAGKAKKGIFLSLIGFLASLISLPLWLPKFFPYNFIIAVLIGLSFFVYCLLDAIKISRSNEYSYTLKKYNKWYIYLIVYLVNALVFSPIISTTVKSNVVKAYKIPSGAMIPTLLIGDHILADKYIYKSNSPERGDIIIFQYPINPEQDFIKRVIGIEGDLIEIKDKKIYLNNQKYYENYIIHLDQKIFAGDEQPRDNYGPITVPANSLFVLGDNRDNSYDSRFWGFVDKKTVKGKASVHYWSWDKDAHKVRWDRIGKEVR